MEVINRYGDEALRGHEDEFDGVKIGIRHETHQAFRARAELHHEATRP